MLGRALTSVIWGVVADKYGRKPVLLITLFTVLHMLFGNAWTFLNVLLLIKITIVLH